MAMSRVEKSCIQRFSLRHGIAGIALNYLLEFCSGRNRKKKDDSRIEAWRLRNASSQRKSAADVCSSHPVFLGKGWRQWCLSWEIAIRGNSFGCGRATFLASENSKFWPYLETITTICDTGFLSLALLPVALSIQFWHLKFQSISVS